MNSNKNNEMNYLAAFQAPKKESPTLSAEIDQPTAKQVWGPFFVLHAPFRGKLSPIGSKGDPILISGRVYGLDTRKGLAYACIDLWQDDSESGEYDYYEPENKKYPYKDELNTHGAAKNYAYRTRLITDETGYYEFESTLPKPYFDPDDSTWRTAHIHYFVQHPTHQSAVSQIYFEGTEKNNVDRHIRPETTLKLETRSNPNGSTYQVGSFDVYLKEGSPDPTQPPYTPPAQKQ